jgi:integral membrane sensor domain MASE1
MSATRSFGSWLVFWVALASVYFGTGTLCISISAVVANVSWMLFIPAALALICALFWGWKVAVGVWFGEFAIALSGGLPVTSGLLMATGNGLEAALAGWWFRDRLGRRIEFDRLDDVLQLLAAELFLLQPLSAGMGLWALVTAGAVSAGQVWTTASAWYAANVFAIFLAAPAALVWHRWSQPARTRREAVELAALGVLTLFVAAFGAGRWAPQWLPLPVTLIFVLPLLVWAAVRFVPSITITVGMTLGLFAFDAVLAGAGPLQGTDTADRIFYLNVFMGVCIGTSLFLAAAMGERRRFEAEQARLIAELEAKAQHVRRLEDFVTFCAWTGRVRWQGQWVSVEQFLHERYGVAISHGISEEAMGRLLEELPPDARTTFPRTGPVRPPPAASAGS